MGNKESATILFCQNVSKLIMELKSIIEKQNEIISLILRNNLGLAFKALSELAYTSRQGEYISEMDNLNQTYKNLLKYSFGKVKDPERDKILSNLKRRMIELTDDISAGITEAGNEWLLSIKKSEGQFFHLSEHEKSALIDEMADEIEFSSLLKQVEEVKNSSRDGHIKYTDTLLKVFNVLWLTNNYSEGEKLIASRLLEAANIPWYDKSIIISAVTLSALRHFDHVKIELLLNAYNRSENQVLQRALVGIVIVLFVYQDRLKLYTEIENRLKAIEDPEKLSRRVEQIILQYIRAQETEKVTEKIQKEIIPEVMKLRPEIEEKLRLDELLNKESLEDKNPDWEQFFNDTPDIYKKLEEFSTMQMDGSDVFMGAFSMLKRFGFFEGISNWFLPFYKDHPEIQKSVSGVSETFNWNSFFESIEEAPVMCNSDKYSFAFNLGFMPDMQKTMMLEFFNAELNQMKEVTKEDNKNNSTAVDKTIFAQYMQDLYRFFKLHPQRNNFYDIFRLKLNVHSSYFLSQVLNGKKLRQIGEFYFQKNYYQQALNIFSYLYKENQSFELLEKIGFCYQKLNQFPIAIDFYRKAEILETNRIWLQKKLGYCYHKTMQFDKAVEYYKRVESAEPDNLEVQAFLGQLYIDMEDYETALKYYFKVEYLKPDLIKVQRPIAWCSFLLLKTDQALRYFKKVVESDGKRTDYLNLGHCYWALGKLTEAIDSYRIALNLSGRDIKWFINSMTKDEIYLKSYGIENLDVILMADYITVDL